MSGLNPQIASEPTLTGAFTTNRDFVVDRYLLEVRLSEHVDEDWIQLLTDVSQNPGDVVWGEEDPDTLWLWVSISENAFEVLNDLARDIKDANEAYRRARLTLTQQVEPDLQAWWRDRVAGDKS